MERKEFMEKVFLVLDYEKQQIILQTQAQKAEKEVEKDAN